MARLCVLMSLFVFGVSFAPVVLTQAAEDKPAEKKSDATADACATFKKCAAACKATAIMLKGEKEEACLEACENCYHMTSVCASMVKCKHAGCDDAKKLCSTMLAECVKECEKSDKECCKVCLKACKECMDCCKAAKSGA